MTQVKSFAGMGEAQLKQLFAGMFTVTSSPLTAHTGVLGSSGLTVRQTTTASASVTVDSGVALSMGSALAGVTPLVSDQVETLDVLDANPMGGVPRNDIVVFDPGTVVAGSGGLRVIVGDPNAVPTDPTVPSTAVPLARLRHAASATTVPSSVIDDLRPFTSMRGGVVQARNTDERGAFDQDATFVYRSDAKVLEVYDGTRWRTHGQVSDAVAGKRTHWDTRVVDIGADGFVTDPIAHGAGFTPRIVDVIYKGATGSLFNDIVTDTYTSTTFRCRMFGLNGASVAATGLSIGFICYE